MIFDNSLYESEPELSSNGYVTSICSELYMNRQRKELYPR